jgi:uncharacterized protein (TIGR02268 family)
MLQPVTPVRALLLLLAVTAAEAQPARSRNVAIAARPGEPLPELRVAAGYTTTLVLDAPVDKGSVQLDTPRDAPRIRLVDVGERSIIFETLVTPDSQERWVLRARYADGAQPEWAAFALVASPGSEVDLQVTAVRPRQALEPCQEQLQLGPGRALVRSRSAPGCARQSAPARPSTTWTRGERPSRQDSGSGAALPGGSRDVASVLASASGARPPPQGGRR